MLRSKYRSTKSGMHVGSALIIVLFTIVLLTALVIAFLSRSLTAVKVSAGSASETKAIVLAYSAGNIIIGDLKQEIAAGSSNATVTTGWPVYLPTSNLTMIPFQNGVPSSNAIPNMVSRSVRPGNTAGYAPYVVYPTTLYSSTLVPPNRAADDTTTPTNVSSATPSINGRYVSGSQWNSHYLIPRNTAVDTAGSTNTDSTPITNFVVPDWVVVTRSGANSVTWNTNLSNASLTNTGFAIGRYAYVVYNEGGLLDMNVAGYPADTTPGGPNGLSATQISRKGSLALADLTQLTVGTTNLTQAQVNNIVGWRNYASAGLSSGNGYFGNFSFTSNTASAWLTNFVTSNTNGYLSVATASSAPTDQAFLSRQQLISLVQSLGISPDYLQYMGTFSRALQQPSVSPDPNRPLILGTNTPPASPGQVIYMGNNNGYQGDNLINPSFLSVRVATSFTRQVGIPAIGPTTNMTSGATAIVGEPLIKTKFNLNRLALVTYNYANTYATAAAAAAANDPVYQFFGIYRPTMSSPWIYNHGCTNSNSQIIIGTLSKVAALSGSSGTITAPREPDFAELLKASMVAGSLAKAAPNVIIGTDFDYQYTLDPNIDYQVIQIMANLIDQQDSDSYPTIISMPFYSGSSSTISYYPAFAGTEDLPYMYRFHFFSVVDQLPSPLISNTSIPTGYPGQAGTNSATPQYTTIGSTTNGQTGYGAPLTSYVSWTASPTNTTTTNTGSGVSFPAGMAKGVLTSPGEATLMFVPDLWNPHDPNTLASSSTNRPTSFRIYTSSTDPAGALTHYNTLGTISEPYGNYYNGWYRLLPLSVGSGSSTVYVCPTSPVYAESWTNTALTFQDNNGTLFREPTLLWNNYPSGMTNPNGMNVAFAGSSGSGSVTDANTSQTYYGIILGKTPISQQVNYTSTPAQTQDGNYIYQGHVMSFNLQQGAGNYPQTTFFLQYQDPNNSTNWITYDWKYPDFHNLNTPNMTVNTSDYANSSYLDPLRNNQFSDRIVVSDPRTSRWGASLENWIGNVSSGTAGLYNTTGANYQGGNSFALEPSANTNLTLNTTTANTAMKNSNFSVLETQRPRADKGNYGILSCPGNGAYLADAQERIFTGSTLYQGPYSNCPLWFMGMTSQNNPAIHFYGWDNATVSGLYFEDPDGVTRLSMGAYNTNLTDTTTNSLATATQNKTRIGLPMATASTFTSSANFATATSQSQSRPLVLNRPFRSVSEMSYAFRGTPWKNIDFFTPASGDSALLDTFCINEPPTTANPMVAGKVDLNTRQAPVIQAIVAGAYRDEVNNSTSSPPSYAQVPLSGTEASNVASTLVAITSDTTHAWRGPLKNISGLVGRYVSTNPTNTDTDFYTYTPAQLNVGQYPSTVNLGIFPPTNTWAGLSSALDCSSFNGVPNHVFSNASSDTNSAPVIQRFREAPIRPLVDAGQVRVWNLLIDVVAQSGRYPTTATALNQFKVDGQQRLWIHVAIDRYTGQVIDKQVEVVNP